MIGADTGIECFLSACWADGLLMMAGFLIDWDYHMSAVQHVGGYHARLAEFVICECDMSVDGYFHYSLLMSSSSLIMLRTSLMVFLILNSYGVQYPTAFLLGFIQVNIEEFCEEFFNIRIDGEKSFLFFGAFA